MEKQSNERYFNSVNLSRDVSMIALEIIACVCDRLLTVDRSTSPDETNHAKVYCLEVFRRLIRSSFPCAVQMAV